jgi:uncharacterized protein (DUF362 family)
MAPQDDRAGRREALVRVLRAGGVGAGAAGLAFWLKSRSRYPAEPAAVTVERNLTVPPNAELPRIAVAQGDDPARLVRRVVEDLGGIRRFVSRGDVVALKPNVSWDRTPEQAANTNPEVVAEVARLCLEAGAKSVVVADVCINEPHRCFERSGIGEAARRAGARVVLPEERLLKQVDLRGEVLRVWPVFTPFLEADKVINLPIAKHHALTGVTLGFKSWYGLLGGTRQRLHQRIHESLADLGDFLRPTLTIVDAYRVLLRGGPGGGNLEDVALKKTVIAGTDPVAVDAYAAKAFWNLEPADLPYLQIAARRGLGTLEFERLGNVASRE